MSAHYLTSDFFSCISFSRDQGHSNNLNQFHPSLHGSTGSPCQNMIGMINFCLLSDLWVMLILPCLNLGRMSSAHSLKNQKMAEETLSEVLTYKNGEFQESFAAEVSHAYFNCSITHLPSFELYLTCHTFSIPPNFPNVCTVFQYFRI